MDSEDSWGKMFSTASFLSLAIDFLAAWDPNHRHRYYHLTQNIMKRLIKWHSGSHLIVYWQTWRIAYSVWNASIYCLANESKSSV